MPKILTHCCKLSAFVHAVRSIRLSVCLRVWLSDFLRLVTDDRQSLLALLAHTIRQHSTTFGHPVQPDETMTTIDFEQYRKPFELDDCWQLKKEFLEKYQNEFELDRLLALGQIFINMEVLGNSYDESIMALIRRLTEGWESLK